MSSLNFSHDTFRGLYSDLSRRVLSDVVKKMETRSESDLVIGDQKDNGPDSDRLEHLLQTLGAATAGPLYTMSRGTSSFMIKPPDSRAGEFCATR